MQFMAKTSPVHGQTDLRMSSQEESKTTMMIVLIVAIFVDIFDEMGIGDDNIVQGVLFNWSRPKSFELKLHIFSMTHL